MTDKELVEQLRKSKLIVGEQSSIVVDFDGEILSGRHRKEADWQKTESIDSRVVAEKLGVSVTIAKEVIRTHFNLQRKPSREETQESLLKIAKELEAKGISKEKIATEVVKLVPYTERWILELLPQEYKQLEKVEAGVKGAEVLQQKRMEFQSRGICSYANCGMGTNYGKVWEGQFVCPNCYDKLERGEITLTQYKPDKKPVEPSPVTVTMMKPKDTWEQRKATMQVPVSKMETAILSKLQINNMHPEVQKEFCLRTTRPDYYFSQQNLAIYLDGEVHRGREDRDEAIRELLAKRHNVRVVTIAYEGSSEATEDSIVQQIIEALAS